MSDPVAPGQKARHLTAQRVQDGIDHAESNEALPHEEAADEYYEPYLCDAIVMLAEQMEFPEQWAAQIGVTEMHMFSWIEKYPEFARAYALAITKLRAAFTAELVNVARGKNPLAMAPLYGLLAKKRFADLYGDAPPPPAKGLAPPRDVTPGSQIIDATAVSDDDADRIRAEIKELRRRHGSE